MTLGSTACDIAVVDLLEQKGPAWSAAVSSLDEATLSRLGATTGLRAQRRLVTGRAHLKRLASARLAVPSDDVRITATCAVCGGPHGAPVVTSRCGGRLSASISHAGSSVLVAVTEDGGGLGVDLVELEAAEFDGFEAAVLAPVECDALQDGAAEREPGWRARVWAAKEAVVKATGHGLVVPLHDVTLPLGDPTGPGMASVHFAKATLTVQVSPLAVPAGFAAAVARVVGPGVLVDP